MAGPKLSTPSPQIFVSDPVEQAFAQGLAKSGPADSAGLYSLMLGAQGRNDIQAQQYRQDLDASNKIAIAMAQQEQRAKLLETSLKEGHHYLGLGVMPNDMPALQSIMNDPGSESSITPSMLAQALKRADIAHKLAQAEQARAAGGDTYTVQTDVSTLGPGSSTVTTKSRDYNRAVQKTGEGVRTNVIQRGLQDPGASTPLLRRGQADVRADEQRRANQKHQNID